MPSSTDRPANILLITTDQQRFDSLGCTGNAVVRTPSLDALAGRGVSFQHGFIQNPVCIPSRACIATGRYSHMHGVHYMENVIGDTPGLPPWELTAPERLQSAGYTTAAYGKVHLFPPRGFDERGLTLGKGARWTVAEGSPLGPSQLGPTYAAWLEARRPGGYEAIYAQRRLPEYSEQATAIVNVLAADEYVDHWIGEQTRDFLRRPNIGVDRPFFLWCGFCGPHGPFDPPEPYASMYDQERMPLPPLLHERQRNMPERRPGRFDRPDGERLIRKLIAYYYGMISLVDDQVGQIMQVLTERGLWENTLVMFTSDHGEMLGDFGRMGKGNFTDAVIRVPYVLVPPGSRPLDAAPPRTVDGLVEHIDLVPTMLDYAGLTQPGELPGMSLRPWLTGDAGPAVTKEAVLCESVSNDQRQRSKCLRTADFKYVFSGLGEPLELYDLEADPQERVNVAGDPAYHSELDRMERRLLDRLLRTEQNAWNSGGSANAPDEEIDDFGRQRQS